MYNTLECGQAFRWNFRKGWYEGSFLDTNVKVSQRDSMVEILRPLSEESINNVINYFSLDTNHSQLEDSLSNIDPYVKASIQFGHGLRLLRQPLWECIVSFIISARNSVVCIKRSVEKLCQQFGNYVTTQGYSFYTFPEPQVLARAKVEDIQKCGVAYRAKYIQDTARKVVDGHVTLSELESLSTDEARIELMKLSGVGRKVADCILLFSLQRYEVFPVDIWIQRVIQYLYFDKKSVKIKDILKFAEDRFGPNAGYVQEYLYFHSRFNKDLRMELQNM